ncbi:MAG: SHOCT domain-containing protein [Burkholderiaceae bacterium]|nr:SHOCT domain-containing protein [Burkholderiaceae bacterium]
MWHAMDGGGWGWTWGIGMVHGLLWWIFVVLGIVLLVRLLARSGGGGAVPPSPPPAPAETALDVLKKRYARGEIDKAEFEEKRRDLQA